MDTHESQCVPFSRTSIQGKACMRVTTSCALQKLEVSHKSYTCKLKVAIWNQRTRFGRPTSQEQRWPRDGDV